MEKIREYVKEAFDEADKKLYKEPFYFKSHISPAHRLAKQLAKKYSADKEIVEVAVLLHDIGLINLPEGEEHDEKGVIIAEELLKEQSFEQEKIEKIKRCILCHDARAKMPQTTEEKIVCTADALSHILTPWYFIKTYYSKKELPDTLKWCLKKLEKDFNRIQFEDEKKSVKMKYQMLKEILTSDID